MAEEEGRRWLGVGAIGLCVVLWVASGQLVQSIFSVEHFAKPFMLTFLSTATFVVLVPVLLLFHGVSNGVGDSLGTTMRAAMGATSSLFLIWFAANYTYNLSLEMTTVSSSTVLSSTSPLWTVAWARILGVERVSAVKVVGALLSVLGVILISHEDYRAEAGRTTVVGDALALLSTIVYALYSVLLGPLVRAGEGGAAGVPHVLAGVGVWTVLAMWPLLLLLHYSGLETLLVPPAVVVLSLVANGIFVTLLSQVLWSHAVIWTSPTIAAVGMTASIPLASLSDYLLHGTRFSPTYNSGASFIGLAFLIVTGESQIVDLLRRIGICLPETPPLGV
mmetsp:Transcript_33080/g.92643  ORF Transcript_33080/g.92643 Transcript_33080/m.92643 type:complete len:334 (+) Transcript_33080:390-1391(+)